MKDQVTLPPRTEEPCPTPGRCRIGVSLKTGKETPLWRRIPGTRETVLTGLFSRPRSVRSGFTAARPLRCP